MSERQPRAITHPTEAAVVFLGTILGGSALLCLSQNPALIEPVINLITNISKLSFFAK